VKEKQNGRTRSGRRLLISEITRLQKNEAPGRNFGITLKINKWALLKETACNKNEIYNIPLPRGPGPKHKTQKKGNESGINYPGELKTLNSSREHKISTRNGSGIVQV
jgi:hypothetical protein